MLYEDFVACDGNWKRGCIYKEICNIKTSATRGIRKWLTEKQLLEFFTEEQTRSIILRKTADPDLCLSEIREHPELPGSGPQA